MSRDIYYMPGFDYYDGDFLNSPGANVPLYDNSQVLEEASNIKAYSGSNMVDSPYTRAISSGVMSNRDNKKAFKAQLDWEADNMAEDARFRRDLAAQVWLRDDERAYNDPAAVRARKIAAGINPDLEGSSGSSGGGSATSVPSSGSSPGVKLDPLADPLQDALTYTGVIGNIGSTISSIVGALNGAVGFAKDVATFDNYVQDAGNSSALLANAVESSSMANVNQRVGLLGDIASTLTPILGEDGSAKPFTIDDITSHLSTLGIADDSGLANGVLSYTQNPALQKLYNDNVLAARRSKADSVVRPFEFVRSVSENNARIESISSEMSLHSTIWTSKVSELLQTDETAQAAVDVGLNTLSSSKNQSELTSDMAVRSLRVFQTQINQLGELRRSVVSRISKLKSNPGGVGSAYKMEIAALETFLCQIDGLGNEQLNLIYDMDRAVRAKAIATEILTDDLVGKNAHSGDVNAGNSVTRKPLWNAYGVYFSDLFGNSTSNSDDSSEGVVGTAVQAVVPKVVDRLIKFLTGE